MFCNVFDCVGQFTGLFCEKCVYFERTGENIKRVREQAKATNEAVQRDFERQRKYEAELQAETDRVWNEYCKQELKKKQSAAETAADEYAEYLRLKAKYEK